jgi:hypothetical protein
MKTAKSIIVVLFVLLTAQIASAYYCPSTGRWLSRDPIGESGFQALQRASVVRSITPSRWINRDSIGETKIQEAVHFQKGLAELMMANPALAMRIQNQLAKLENNSNNKVDPSASNLYMFVENNPASDVDVLGLDIWYHYCVMLCPCKALMGVVTAWTFWPVSETARKSCCGLVQQFFCDKTLPLGGGNWTTTLAEAEIYFQGCLLFSSGRP